ncbi:unnamed protein product [Coregonus sp. 'balchen']|nr:unnamed protein product [Coregonus sp. 'balchen']
MPQWHGRSLGLIMDWGCGCGWGQGGAWAGLALGVGYLGSIRTDRQELIKEEWRLSRQMSVDPAAVGHSGQLTTIASLLITKATAWEMGKVAEQMGADFVLALGDNFYYSGVNSADSPRFQVSCQAEIPLSVCTRLILSTFPGTSWLATMTMRATSRLRSTTAASLTDGKKLITETEVRHLTRSFSLVHELRQTRPSC